MLEFSLFYTFDMPPGLAHVEAITWLT